MSYEASRTILVYTFLGSWIGGVFYDCFLLLRKAFFWGYSDYVLSDIVVYLSVVFMPISAIKGLIFWPPAFLSGVVASFLKLSRTPVSLVFISTASAALSYLHADIFLSYVAFPYVLETSLIAFLASIICGLYVFPEPRHPELNSKSVNAVWKPSTDGFLVSDELLQQIWNAVQGSDANALWTYVCLRVPRISVASYQVRKDFFLCVVSCLMKEGRLKLAHKGKYCPGAIEEQVQGYFDRWPEDEAKLDRINFQFTVDSEGRFVDFWAKCGFVWVYKDGFEIWTYAAHKLRRYNFYQHDQIQGQHDAVGKAMLIKQ